MWPALLAGLGGTALNYYGNEQARKDSNRAMDRAGAVQEAMLQEYMQNVNPAVLDQLNTAYTQGLQNTAPGSYTYSPEQYQFLDMPTLEQHMPWEEVQAQQVADSPEARAIQYQALQDLQQRAEEGLTAQDQADYMRGRSRAGEFARGREGAIQRDLEARGMGGSGIEAAMRQIASQQATGQVSEMEAMKAAENAKMRAMATQAAMAGGAQLRGADIGLNQANANILNDFAWDNSAQKQRINNMNTELKNKQIIDKITEQRRIGDANTGLANTAQMVNQDRQINQDVARKTSANQNLMTQGGLENENIMAKYGANKDFWGDVAGMRGAQLPGIYAQGAGDAAYQRGKWGTVAQGLQTAGDIYNNERYLDRKYPQQKG